MSLGLYLERLSVGLKIMHFNEKAQPSARECVSKIYTSCLRRVEIICAREKLRVKYFNNNLRSKFQIFFEKWRTMYSNGTTGQIFVKEITIV